MSVVKEKNTTAASADEVPPRGPWLGLFDGGWRRTALRWGFFLSLGLLLYYFAWPQLFAWHHARRADQALANDDCVRARVHLEKCLSVWSDSGQRHFQLARCCWREGDLEAADKHLRKARRFRWPGEVIDMELLFIEAQGGMNPELEKAFERIVKFAQNDQDQVLEQLVFEAAVLSFMREGRLREARGAARKLVALREDSWRAQTLLGKALSYSDPELTRQAYERSLTGNPDQPAVHFWLAQHYARSGPPQDALDHLEASGVAPASALEIQMILARVHYRLGNWATARKALDKAMQDGADKHGPALALRGLVELEEKGVDDAAAWMDKAEKLAPHHPDILDALGTVATRQGDSARIAAHQKRRQQLEMDMDALAKLQEQMSKLNSQPPRDAAEKLQLSYQLGLALFKVGQDDPAVKWMKSVIKDNPAHVEAHRALAEYYLRVGETRLAEEHALEARSRKGG